MAVKDGLPSTDFSRMNREWVKAVADGGSGGVGLPAVTAVDNGKILGVVNGEWGAMDAPGGGGSSLPDEVFHHYGSVKINVSGVPEGQPKTLSTEITTIMVYSTEGEYGYNVVDDPFQVLTGETNCYIFSVDKENAVIAIDSSNWTITIVSGNATYNEEDGDAWISITGDCEFNAVYTGS